MKRTFLALIAVVAIVAALGGQTLAATTCTHDNTMTSILCVWDAGCCINPFTPDGQYGYYEYWHYTRTDGTSYWKLYDKFEFGGCCNP